MKKILVANRGEIALRIMRSAREMGISTVAVYSEADRNSPHVRYADEAVCIGPAASSASYLKGEVIIEHALKLGVDGIHPGYGFLSENAEFSRAVTAAGITFIGPKPESMEMMGSKLAAKAAAKKHNIPLVPGTEEAIEDVDDAIVIAGQIGYPVLIKASAGGGGKGMRIVEKEEDFREQLQLAISEATSAFGDGSVFIERYVAAPRHIEIQIMADTHGNCVYLFERECSIQRRHQKVIEEAPSVVVSEKMRKEMGECAVRISKACDYVGAGTVEFLVDENLDFYFLEMNTRLQVEHPVTEFITGKDLVKEQIKVARGEILSFTQDELTINGHSIEIRVYAENAAENFLPDIGKLLVYKLPEGNGVRVDGGFEEGMDIPIYYDPMISKLIVHADTREDAIEKMLRAIRDYEIGGVETTLSFCRFALNHQAFRSGNFDTNFVKHYFKPEFLYQDLSSEEMEVAAIFAASSAKKNKVVQNAEASPKAKSLWKERRYVN
ncbi:MAG: acetyl-CoA carboxylase biotin carboxylase subunit [Bacteroidia bacterium]